MPLASAASLYTSDLGHYGNLAMALLPRQSKQWASNCCYREGGRCEVFGFEEGKSQVLVDRSGIKMID